MDTLLISLIIVERILLRKDWPIGRAKGHKFFAFTNTPNEIKFILANEMN